jgi:hypothetical protein
MMVVRCTGACLGLARSQRSRLVLALEVLRVLAPRDLSQMCKYEMPTQMQCMGGAKVVYYMLIHDLTIIAFRAIY